MSVPADRMTPRSGAQIKDPTKIMGVKKPIFWGIIVAGLFLAFYIWRKSKSTKSSDLQSANAGAEPDTTNGVTAADIGGTPADNSFATNTDLTAIEEQIQQLQDSLFQLQQSNGGNGAGLSTSPASPPLPVRNPPPTTTSPVIGPTGNQSGGGQPTDSGIIVGQPISFPFPGISSSTGPFIPAPQGGMQPLGGVPHGQFSAV